MKSKGMLFFVLAVAGLVLGGGLALMTSSKNTSGTSEPAMLALEQPAAGETAAMDTPVLSAQPVLEGVPPMPVASVGETSITAAPVVGSKIGGRFSLTDTKGAPATEKSWPGKYTLVFFGFTNCPDICPTTLQKLSAVMEKMDAKGEKLAPIFITVDPARDTKEVMTAYIAKFSPTITGLTGTQEQVEQAVEAYKVFTAKVPDGHEYVKEEEGHDHKSDNYMMDHSGYTYFMSPEGVLLETFSVDETAEGMMAKIKAHTDKAVTNSVK